MDLSEEAEDRLETLEQRMLNLEKSFKEAFPAGDWAGHCRYHEIQIEMLLERRKLTAAVQEKTLVGVMWLVIGVVAMALWQWFKGQMK